MIVIDANLLLSLLVPGEATTAAAAVFSRDPDWIGPPLLRSEFRNALSTMIRRQMLDREAAFFIVEEAERQLDGNEIPVNSADVLTLSAQSACSAYDCEYVALAQALRIPLVTLDGEILAAFPKIAVAPERFART